MRGSSFSYFVREGFKNIWSNAIMSLASVSVLVACLIILGSFVLAVYNIKGYIERMEQENEIVIFIDESFAEQDARALKSKIDAIDNVSRCVFVSKDDAFNEYKSEFEDGDELFDGLKENPLRHSFRIFLKDLSQSEDTITKINQIEGIAKIRSRKDITENLLSLQRMITVFAGTFFVIFFSISVFIISNTVRLAVFARRREINIMKYVGATNWFIRWPFIIEGFIIGAFGGLVAYFAQWGIYNYLSQSILKGISIIQMLPFADFSKLIFISFLGAGILLGVGGSLISVRKHLKV